MDSFELREELNHGGRVYFLQTSYLPQEGQIQSSFFKNGVLFDTVIQKVDENVSSNDLKSLTKEIHVRNKDKLYSLLCVRDKVKGSEAPVPHLKLAQALYRRNLFTESIQEAELAMQKGDRSSKPYMVIGESLFKMGEHTKGFDAVQRGISINPEYPDLHNLLGLIYLKQNRCKPAIDCFKRAIGLNLYYGEPYLNLAKAYLLNTIVKEDYELSRNLDENFNAHLEKASQLNPFLKGETFEVAKHQFEENEYEEAYKTLDSVKGGQNRTGIEDIILELYLDLLQNGGKIQEKDIDMYMERIDEIIDRNPTFADGFNSLGILYAAKCKIFLDRARDVFRQALEINKNYKKAQKNLRLTENERQGIFILLKALLD